MNDTRDLDTQIAVHLFGWRWLDDAQLWRDPDGLVCDAQAFRRRLPAYSRVPDATALVWQWLQDRESERLFMEFDYRDKSQITCHLLYARYQAEGRGASWQEALCRAALNLAEAREGEA